LLQLASHNPDIWADIMRARTLNAAQATRGQEQHICPLQIDVVDRCVRLYSNPGELVGDPFGGLMTVPARALALGRRGFATELAPNYFKDGLFHLKAAEQKLKSPSLFDLLEAEASAEELPEESEEA
jgi:DNA modification methylase